MLKGRQKLCPLSQANSCIVYLILSNQTASDIPNCIPDLTIAQTDIIHKALWGIFVVIVFMIRFKLGIVRDVDIILEGEGGKSLDFFIFVPRSDSNEFPQMNLQRSKLNTVH